MREKYCLFRRTKLMASYGLRWTCQGLHSVTRWDHGVSHQKLSCASTKAAAKPSVTVFTCTATSDKNMAISTDTSTTEHHGKLLVLLVAITFIFLGPTIFCDLQNQYMPWNTALFVRLKMLKDVSCNICIAYLKPGLHNFKCHCDKQTQC